MYNTGIVDMSNKDLGGNAKQQLIAELNLLIKNKIGEENSKLIREFVGQFYLGAAVEDLNTHTIDDIYGSVISLWNFISKKINDHIKIHVFNPKYEQHGWQSPHTIIQIIVKHSHFVVDSVRVALLKNNLNIHSIIHSEGLVFTRDEYGNITAVLPCSHKQNEEKNETVISIEIDNQADSSILKNIESSIKSALMDVKIVVDNWRIMQDKMLEVIELLDTKSVITQQANQAEIKDFLQWIAINHFTFLGFAEHVLSKHEIQNILKIVPGSELGILAKKEKLNNVEYRQILSEAEYDVYNSKSILLLGKTNIVSTVHRNSYLDFIGIKKFDDKNNVTGEFRFVGLYTAEAYNNTVKKIPYLRSKVANILTMTDLPAYGHTAKELTNILDTLPRDELFNATEEELYAIATGILHLEEKKKLKLFIRKDLLSKYYSCLVYIPREKFNSELRSKMQDILMRELKGKSVTFATRFSESTLARVHYVIRVAEEIQNECDIGVIQQQLIKASRSWKDDLKDAIYDKFGEAEGNDIISYYLTAFPTSYQECFDAKMAVLDIEHIETLIGNLDKCLVISLYKLIEDQANTIRIKLFRVHEPTVLSDVVPMLENMGLRIMSEQPYLVKKTNNGSIWINDYKMECNLEKNFSLDEINEIFIESFYAIWQNNSENDAFNKLVIAAQLNWRQIYILRAYYKYLKQTGLLFSLEYVAAALFNNRDITKKLITLFNGRFNLESKKTNDEQLKIKHEIIDLLNAVQSLNEDRIIRCYIDMIFATIRTNYFQKEADGTHKVYFSFKFDSKKVPNLPLPLPLYEIFVCSPRMEGIHLRGDLVSRGGIRYSDRTEDYRTEVLGLMKAQQAKNSVIVPFGAKGGFIVKKITNITDKEVQKQEVISCYQNFICGLLDLTDNIKNDIIISPMNVVKYDTDDPYLVVAADKGTATFSDIANKLSLGYGFWLHDAFASGGSDGYDHKKMAITAKGAWESVKANFHRLGKNIQNEEFTVVGIGDLAGDVFGNGMLLSNKMQLIAAFNHMHIFIDPNPDCETSFKERQRMFSLETSTWDDYNKTLLSKGGGVYLRSLKNIVLSAEAQKRFNLKTDQFVPNDLIKLILASNYDLLWNGGIGTFFKAKHELQQNVGDRNNDLIRINGCELRCKVVGEGGNLGFTQLARVEYAKQGGGINTDFIDNSAGVNCSDMEVNLKILLNSVIHAEDLTIKQRNELLIEMKQEVETLVLQNNIKQNYAITMTAWSANSDLAMHSRLLKNLEKKINLNREVEYLPNAEEINSRKKENHGLTRPEIAVVMAYVKILLKKELLSSALPEDNYFKEVLVNYFPKPAREKLSNFIYKHKLKREIIATQISNLVVNDMGLNFVLRLEDETGAANADIVKAYLITKDVFSYEKIRDQIYFREKNIKQELKMTILHDLNSLMRRGTRWFLKNKDMDLDVKKLIDLFSDSVHAIHKELFTILEEILDTDIKNEEIKSKYVEQGLSTKGVQTAMIIPYMFSTLYIVDTTLTNKLSAIQVARLYFIVGASLHLNWFREKVQQQKVHDHWDALARGAFIDDVDRQQRDITIAILLSSTDLDDDEQQKTSKWMAKNAALLVRWQSLIEDLKSTDLDFTKFAVALRELLNLSQKLL